MKYMVAWDGEDGHFFPQGEDPDCEGAICSLVSSTTPVAMFGSKTAAKKAIEISRRYAELLKSQGKTYNDDYISGIKNIKVIPLKEVDATDE